jgi:hypothetical protein
VETGVSGKQHSGASTDDEEEKTRAKRHSLKHYNRQFKKVGFLPSSMARRLGESTEIVAAMDGA